MKKVISLLVILVMLGTCTAHALPGEQTISVYVDGIQLEFDVNPIAENGRTLVPMRYIFEALGAEVNWIGEENRIVATKDDITIDLTLGTDVMYRNNTPVALDVPAKAVDGRTLVPARAVAEALDAAVEWIGEEYRVEITSAENLIFADYYSHTELSAKDMTLLRTLYPKLYNIYAAELLYENMAEYPEDIRDLIALEDARIRMFADDVWNNMMAHIIITIQADSTDDYLFDIPDDVEIESYALMDDYIPLTEKENMSSEAVIQSSLETTPGGEKVLLIRYHRDFDTADSTKPVITDTAVISTRDGFRYFNRLINPLRSSVVQDIWEMTSEGIADAGTSSDYSPESFLRAIDKILGNTIADQ